MSQLRWTLLILGVVFVAVLAWWERRRPRQAWAGREPAGDRAREPDGGPAASPPTVQPFEPWIGDTELSEVVLSDLALSSAAAESEAMPAAPRVAATGPLDELPTLLIGESGKHIAPEGAGAMCEPPEGAGLQALEERDPVSSLAPAGDAELETEQALEAEPSADEEANAADSAESEEQVGPVRLIEPAHAEASPERIEPVVEWPPEESRRVLTLRLVAPQPERFPGRALRLALAAEGFRFGKFSIFHKPDEANRALVSATSLTRPGSFDLEVMDSQRFAGLNLFAVLPGPREPREAFEELLAAARNLNERLAGALQDERGGPLTPLRVASLRDGLSAEAAVGS